MRTRSARGVVLGALLFIPSSAVLAEIERGDINNDGVIDVSDVVRLFEWLSTSTQTDICYKAADVNGDGYVNITDAICILNYMYGTGDVEGKPFPQTILDACFDHEEVIEMAEVEINVLTPRSAIVSWLTAVPAPSLARRSTGPDFTVDVVEKRADEEVTWHEVLLEDLEPGTTYYYQAESALESGKVVKSPINRFTTLAVETYTVRPDHPRIFITAEDVPFLRAIVRDGGAHEKSWELLAGWVRSVMDSELDDIATSENVDARVRGLALTALLGGNSEVRDKAIAVARHLAGKRTSNDKDMREYAEAMAFVYDWLHGDLSDDAKSEIRDGIIHYVTELEDMTNNDEYVTGTSHGHTKSVAIGSLAVYGEHERAEVLLDRMVRDYRNGFLATWRRFSGSSGGSSKGWAYTSFTLPFETEFFAAWKSATGDDWFQKERVWCEPMLDWFFYGLRNDHSFMREGDYSGYRGMLVENRVFANMVGKEYGNASAQWLGDRVHDGDPIWGFHAAVDILWRDPSLQAVPPSGPTSKLFRNVGVAIMRESLAMDSSIATFRSAEVYTSGHTHRDNCSFTVFHKAPLAIDSGLYDDFSSSHHDNYYSRTIAHNTITVFDPDERFEKYDEVFSNDGGQRWLDENEVEHPWPTHADRTVDRNDGYRLGGIRRYEQGKGYAYTCGNGTPSYSERKLRKFYRHFLWLERVDGWEHPVIVVFDDVVGTRAEFKKTYHLHSVREPEVNGPLVTLRNGNGLLHQLTLSPSDFEIEVVGGDGKEFWVDGQNYPPDGDTRPKDEPGAWRVEVSAPRERTEDHFLHVLFVGDEDSSSPPEAVNLAATGMQGCEVGDWTVLFDHDGPIENIEYVSSRPTSKHLLFGASPLTSYDVYLDGTYYNTVDATFSGTLTFETHMAANVRVARQ